MLAPRFSDDFIFRKYYIYICLKGYMDIFYLFDGRYLMVVLGIVLRII